MSTPHVLTSANDSANARARVPLGIILYQGPSLYDGAPIVAIATGIRSRTTNRKTGDMVQTWILRADVPPVEALKDGADASVCGACPLRPQASGGCYVNVGQAPGAIWRAYRAGRYADASPENLALLNGRAIRFGAYGDPAAVPDAVWTDLRARSRRHTAYSHGATVYGFDRIANVADYAMVSVSSLEDASAAWSRGFRTFRTGHGAPVPGEILCPSERVSCVDCGLCDGLTRADVRALPSIFIPAHGVTARRIPTEV
jgi:hypothetical protein